MPDPDVRASPGAVAAAAPASPTGFWESHYPTVGETTMPRALASGAALATTAGLRLTYFTPRTSETITQVRVLSGTTAAGATPTLIRFGIYRIDATGAGTLIASTANDTALLAAASTTYTKTLEAAWSKVAAQRYAFGVLVVTAAAFPTMQGFASTGAATNEPIPVPKYAGLIGSVTDLPASFVDGTVSASGQLFYAHFIP